jgi:sialic acid synthase SpsE
VGLLCFSSPFDETAVDFLEDLGELDSCCTQLVLLKCTSAYPASPENKNIRTIPHQREMFGFEVGWILLFLS